MWFFCLILVLPQLIAAQRQIFVSSPNIIRVGNTETVLINVFNTEEVSVTVKLKYRGSDVCPEQVVNVQPDNPQLVSLFVDPERIPLPEAEEDVKLYAQVEVTCDEIDGFHEEADVLINFEQGFVFIQTDKPIYTPDQRVSIRLLVLDQYLRPSDQLIQLDVVSPQDVIVYRASDIHATNGIKTHVFNFPHEPLFGNWSVVAAYGTGYISNRTVQFEVKEYVLPTFYVEINTPSYILEGQEAIDCSVTAKYVYNKPVVGTYYAKIGILGFDGEIDFKEAKAGQLIADGIGHFQINTANDLGENWYEDNLGKRLYIEVAVMESASGHFENATDASLKFVRSPYNFKWDRTVQYFKKGLPYEVKVDLTYANDQPVGRIGVKVIATGTIPDGQDQLLFGEEVAGINEQTLATTNDKGQVNFHIDVPRDCQSIHIKLQTMDPDLGAGEENNNNAVLEFDLQPYESPTANDYLLIRLNTDDFVDVDALLDVEALVQTNDFVPFLAYYVITKGRIVHANVLNFRIPNVQGFTIPVTFDMIPSARIVAYYINQHGQVVADSLWIEVQRVCENRVSVSVVGHRTSDVLEPDSVIELQIDALPSTTVGILAVDKAVLLLRDYHRLTRDKMYQTMDTYDSGCGPGGGRDSPDIFKNAGVTVLSNANLDASRREVFGCPTPTNPRRRRSLQDQRDEYAGIPEEAFACKRGHRLLHPELSCEEKGTSFLNLARRKYSNLTEERLQEVKDIFIICCTGAKSAQTPSHEAIGRVGGDFVNFDLIDDNPQDVKIRSDFKETWIFEEIEIGRQGFVRQPFSLPSSITEWSVTAFGLSSDYAMCVAEPVDIIARSDLFIQLHMPYSVVRLEQVEIVATVYNYAANDFAVRVFLQTNEKVCTEGIPNEYSAEKEFVVEANSAFTVKYVVIGLEVGEHPINILALSVGFTDGIQKLLRVKPEGIERSFFHSTTLDPSGSMIQQLGHDIQARAGLSDFRVNEVNLPGESLQVNLFDIRLPSSTVPSSEKCEVSIIGNVLGPVITSVIDGLESLLTLPRGCGEQTMIYMAPNVYVLRYLTSVDASTLELEEKARSNIREGVVREMVHRHHDGSFSVWGTNPNYPSSTWLTAFVNKVFCHAKEFEFIDSKVTCQAIEWLIDSSQQANGSFRETYRIHHREMTGGVQGEATLTAFVLISIHECQCDTMEERIELATTRAVTFLEGQLFNLQRPYALAIVAYALALVESPLKHDANLLLKSMDTYDEANGLRYWRADASSLSDSNKPYWYRARPSAITVETTGYALLAQLALGDISYSQPIVKWLSEQQNYGGGFASTQDTTIALQALTEYAILNDGGDIDMTCTVEQIEGEYSEEFHFTRENALVQKHATPPLNGTLRISSAGRGTGKLNVKVTYNSISPQRNEIQCPFEININAREARSKLDNNGPPEEPPRGSRIGGGGDGRSRIGRLEKRQVSREDERGNFIVNVALRVRYKKNVPTNMAIIDVGIYSGFEPIEEDLRQICQENDYIKRYEISQRSVIFYADHIPPVDQLPILHISFNVQRVFTVGNIQPVAVRVYDYYNPSEECVKFYHPATTDPGSELLSHICEGDVCLCAAGDCVDCATNDKEELLKRSCATGETYAYQVLIMEKDEDEFGFTVYSVKITEVLKRADDEVFGDEIREFWATSSCDCTMRVNKLYLVIGKTILPYATEEGENSIKYILDSFATVEQWPERRRRKNQVQFDKMEEFRADMRAGNNNCQ